MREGSGNGEAMPVAAVRAAATAPEAAAGCAAALGKAVGEGGTLVTPAAGDGGGPAVTWVPWHPQPDPAITMYGG